MATEDLSLADLRADFRRLEAMVAEALGRKRLSPWMSGAAAARQLGISVPTFRRRFVDTGEVRSRKAGSGRRVFRRRDVESLSNLGAV
jgi:hypothetical protein